MEAKQENEMTAGIPAIIQGGMGAGVSNWRLAQAVARCGGLGVVSGTALDTILIRRLQDGDEDGAMRRGLAAFPDATVAEAILERWYVEGGRAPDAPYRVKALPTVGMTREAENLLIAANFVEVFLAKEGHSGKVGINLLEKIQLPTLPSLFGAMLAGVDVVIMGGGIPLAIPGILDALSRLEPVEMKLNVADASADKSYNSRFVPCDHMPDDRTELKRPAFLAVIASEILAKTLVRKASGHVDGFVVEHYSAGGHNAPPRRDGVYGEKDLCAPERIAALGRPFWLAGSCASPERLRAAQAEGAAGIQVGTAFACAEESGIMPWIKEAIMQRHRAGTLEVITDFQASPTTYPFKRVDLSGEGSASACRACDLGYLRHLYERTDGAVGYRCPAEPRQAFLAKGGSDAEAEGTRCLCNGLLATIGLGQIRKDHAVPPLVTWGEDMSFLDAMTASGRAHYSAADLMAYLESA